MFYGEYQHTIDNKGRLVLPSQIRETARHNLIDKFFVTRGLDKCLFMLSEDEWRSQEAKFKSLSFTKTQARIFNRIYFSGAVEIIPDKQGRILVPQYLKEYAFIKREVVLVGVSNRVEIWARDMWEKFYQEAQPSFEKIAEDVLGGE